ncbi:MAG: DUF885 domain-containing protein [Deltaproteobacteria bacterium]|nr:DUF885 domain-containing protein [Deltaproteobacteria bacterium]
MNDILPTIAEGLFGYLGKAFPVCCGSDEFYFFPQVIPQPDSWLGWDDFSPGKIEEVKNRLSLAETEIGLVSRNTEDPDLLADAETLGRMVSTLREQLGEVRFHQTQPTFHLTILCTALASSLGDPDSRAWSIRAQTVPAFLTTAREALTDMPRLFRDLGLEMVRDVQTWLRSLTMAAGELAPVASAIERFEDFLLRARTGSDYLLPPEIVARIVREHIGCGVGPAEVRDAIRQEIGETDRFMEEVCRRFFPGDRWREAVLRIPLPAIPKEGPLTIYREAAEDLLRHCIGAGIVPEDLPGRSPLRVATLPPYLRAIRAASAYSFTPGNPTQKGTFYIVPPDGSWDDSREDLVDYRMLTAHETYPGHHLLDSWRWQYVSPARRPVETPLFYEGWACFAEELMRLTGYFSAPADLLLLAKRRYRRAVRGLVDLELQTGERDLRSAAHLLAESGFTRDAASAVVAKYALRPGYQVCYTFGLRRFLDLYERYGTQDAKRFVETVLSGGEIGFAHVETALRRH